MQKRPGRLAVIFVGIVDFRFDHEPGQTAHVEVVAAVFHLLVLDDPPQARHGFDRRRPVVVFVPIGLEQHQCDQLICVEGVGCHLAVPVLEDVQPLIDVGEQHQVRQREQPGDTLERLERSLIVRHGRRHPTG